MNELTSKIRISVIVPIYNAEKYLQRLLDSLKNQTFKDFEVILVNDGSTDMSLDICNRQKLSDKRFKVYTKNNEGVSAARQYGFEKACGEYVIHADADDWCESDMLFSLYNTALNTNSDMVICDYFYDDEYGSSYIQQRPTDLVDNDIIIRDFAGSLIGTTWNKLIRRECINKYALSFPQGINYSEDLIFLIQLLRKPVKCSYLNRAFYHYTQGDSSITHTFSKKNFQDRERALSLIESILPASHFRINHESFVLSVLIDFLKSGIYDPTYLTHLSAKCNYEYSVKRLKSHKFRIALLCLKHNNPRLAWLISKIL